MDSRGTIIGVLSDTHGRGDLSARAVAVFAANNVVQVFHCGDIGGPAVVDALAGLSVTYVLGNMDRDHAGLGRYIRSLGATLGEPVARCELAGKRIAVLHGDEGGALRGLIDSQELDYLFHGHTHTVRIERVGRTQVVNPGALAHSRLPTVAVVDLSADVVRIVPLTGAGPGG